MIKVHAFKVEEAPNSQPLEEVLEYATRTKIEDRILSVGNRELQIEDAQCTRDGYWLFDVSCLNFGAGPGRGKRGAETHGFQLKEDEAFSEMTGCLYCPIKKSILIEYKHAGARSGAIQDMLGRLNPNKANAYEFLLQLDPQTVGRIDRKQVLSKLHLKIAPTRLRDIDRQKGVALGIALDQSDKFGGQILNLEVTTEPYSRASLVINRVRKVVDWIRTVNGRGDDAILLADITGRDDDDSKSELIKILDQKLEKRFNGYNLGPDRRYRQGDRYEALERCYHDWEGIL